MRGRSRSGYQLSNVVAVPRRRLHLVPEICAATTTTAAKREPRGTRTVQRRQTCDRDFRRKIRCCPKTRIFARIPLLHRAFDLVEKEFTGRESKTVIRCGGGASSSSFPSQASPAGQSQEAAVVESATNALTEFMSMPNEGIPRSMLANAQGLVIVPAMVKVGLVAGVRHGKGIAVIRDDNGVWRPPTFVSMTGGSVGWQVGIQSTDVILVFNTRRERDRSVERQVHGGRGCRGGRGSDRPTGLRSHRRATAGGDLFVFAQSRSVCRCSRSTDRCCRSTRRQINSTTTPPACARRNSTAPNASSRRPRRACWRHPGRVCTCGHTQVNSAVCGDQRSGHSPAASSTGCSRGSSTRRARQCGSRRAHGHTAGTGTSRPGTGCAARRILAQLPVASARRLFGPRCPDRGESRAGARSDSKRSPPTIATRCCSTARNSSNSTASCRRTPSRFDKRRSPPAHRRRPASGSRCASASGGLARCQA